MSQHALESFGAYRKAIELFDLVVTDMEPLRADGRCYRLISQQVASADSICANIEKGHGRLSRKEHVLFLDIARGSARETRGRYARMKHWLAPETVDQRLALADEIIGILTTSIAHLRRDLSSGHDQRTMSLREEEIPYGSSSTLNTHPPSPDTRPSFSVPRHSPPGTPPSP